MSDPLRGWETMRLGDLCDIKSGGTPKKSEPSFWKGDIPWVTAKDLKQETISDAQMHVTSDAIAKSSTKLAPVGSVLMLVRGMGLANGMQMSEVSKPVTFNQDVRALIPNNPDELSTRFLYLAIKSNGGDALLSSAAHGTLKIDSDKLRALPIPLPPLSEQRRIVSVLDAAFAGLATATAHTQKNLQNARELFETHLNQVFTKQHSGWSTSPLDDAVETIATGPFGSLLHKSDYVEDGTPLVNPINIVDELIEPNMRKTVNENTRNRLKNYELHTNDIVIGRRGEIGRCAVVTQHEAGWLCGTGCFIIRTGDQMDPYFLCHLLRSDRYRSLLEGQAGRATMPSISNKQLAQLVIHYPSVTEQRRINDQLKGFADTTMQFSEIARRKLAALSELKQSLLHRAFRGELSGGRATCKENLQVQSSLSQAGAKP